MDRFLVWSVVVCAATMIQGCAGFGDRADFSFGPKHAGLRDVDGMSRVECGECCDRPETSVDRRQGTICEGCGTHQEARDCVSGLDGGVVRGREHRVLDGIGWVAGMPSKILLWNSQVDNHDVSPETEKQLQQFLNARGLSDVKVRINQYDPAGEWARLIRNQSIHPGWKYTVGALTVTRDTLLPGRVFGGDRYNPFTHSISLYSDQPAIALREAVRAEQVSDATYRGLYAASMYLPGSPLWVDTPAIREVLSYSQQTGQHLLERQAYLVLFPAHGMRVGESFLLFADPGVGQAGEAAFAFTGHVIGRTLAFQKSRTPVEMVKSVYGIVRRRPESDTDTDDTANTTPTPADDPPLASISFVPVEVVYHRPPAPGTAE